MLKMDSFPPSLSILISLCRGANPGLKSERSKQVTSPRVLSQTGTRRENSPPTLYSFAQQTGDKNTNIN